MEYKSEKEEELHSGEEQMCVEDNKQSCGEELHEQAQFIEEEEHNDGIIPDKKQPVMKKGNSSDEVVITLRIAKLNPKPPDKATPTTPIIIQDKNPILNHCLPEITIATIIPNRQANNLIPSSDSLI